MEALQASLAARPGSLAVLEEAAGLQACGRCCLRLAGVHDAAAYADSSVPASAATLLHRLEFYQTERGHGMAAETEAQGGGKRRRLDDAGSAPAAGAGAGDGPLVAPTDAAGAVGDRAAAVCPLCLGLLQAVGPAAGAAGDSCQQLLRCSLQLVTTISSLNEPQRHAVPAFGTTPGVEATPAAAAEDGQGQERAHDSGTVGAPLAPVVTQRASPVPSLAAAAATIAAEYEFDSFALEVSLPASLAVRQQALSWRLRQGGGFQERAAALAGALDMKEAVRLCFSEALAAALGRPHDADAALRISLTASHPDAAAECSWLAPFEDAGGNRQRRGGRGGRHHQRHPAPPDAAAPALTDALAARLASMLAPQFAAACPPAAAQLLPPATPAAVQLQARRRLLLVGGRYLKLRRGIPQSPWVIDGQRKGEGSVQEAIERAVLPAFRADSFTLVSAGREDIDVRMLGEGRPFILQIENARRGMPPPERLQGLGAEVLQASAGGVAVHGLFAALPAQLARLKEGEQEKEKSYVAVCWLPRPLTDADVAAIAGARGLEVQQQTPVRVLHRRANLERPRTVHEMAVQRLAGPPDGRGSYFALRLRTQAGTYIKEFVHGDLGRTRPSLGDLLGGCRAQIVSLDVEQVHMDFGPQRQ